MLRKDGKTKIYAWLLLREKDTWRYTFKQIETNSLASRWPSPCPNQGSEQNKLSTLKSNIMENLSNNELIDGIYHNIYSDCQDNNDYKVRNILDCLGNDTEAIIDFLEENITDTGEDFLDMFYEENNFTDEQREIIRNYNGDVEFIYCQRLELFCDIRTGAFNAGEDNYIRIFEGEDWKDVAREIAEDYDKMKNSK